MSFHCRQNKKCAISRISLEFSSFWATLGSVQAKLSNLNSEGHLGSSRALLLNMGRAKLLTGIFVFDLLLLLQWFSSFSTKVSKDLRSSVSISLAISEELHLLKIRQKWGLFRRRAINKSLPAGSRRCFAPRFHWWANLLGLLDSSSHGVINVNLLLPSTVRQDLNPSLMFINDHSCNLSIVQRWSWIFLEEKRVKIVAYGNGRQAGSSDFPSVLN